jgi:hypothetical protein
LVRRRAFDIFGIAGSLRIAAAMACVLFPASGASAAGIESCEKIKDADAYNNCLASFGPAFGEHRFTRAPPPAAETEAEPPRPGQRKAAGANRARKAAPAAAQAEKQGPKPKRQANGRVRIEIFPGR